MFQRKQRNSPPAHNALDRVNDVHSDIGSMDREDPLTDRDKTSDREEQPSGDELRCAYRKAATYQAADEADFQMRLARAEARLKTADKNIRRAAARRQLST